MLRITHTRKARKMIVFDVGIAIKLIDGA